MNPNSGLTSYLTAQQFLLRRDPRTVVQNATDDPNDPLRVAPIPVVIANLSDPQTYSGKILDVKLKAASGMLESACLRSQRYSPADLLSLEGNSAEYMQEILSSLVMFNLIGRRPGPAPPDTVVTQYEEAIKALNDLSEGIRIFAFQEVEQAGLPQTNQFNQSDLIQNDAIVARWTPMFGNRQLSRRYTAIGWGGGCR